MSVTNRQRQVLHFIHECWLRQGVPPTMREIGKHFGIRSTNGVSEHLDALVKKGLLKRAAFKSRCMQVTTKGFIELQLGWLYEMH
jgi:repressor LexA